MMDLKMAPACKNQFLRKTKRIVLAERATIAKKFHSI